MWDAGLSHEVKSFNKLDLSQKYGGFVLRLHRGEPDTETLMTGGGKA